MSRQRSDEHATGDVRARPDRAGRPLNGRGAREDRAGGARHRAGAARNAGAHAPLAAAALAASRARRRRPAAGAARPAAAGSELRGRNRSRAASACAGSPCSCGDARRSPCRRRATPGRASCTASAGCAISAPRGAWRTRRLARSLVAEWIAGRRRHTAHAWAPEVVGRRIISWLSHAGLILDGAERRPYAAIMLSLEDQVTYLSASWRNAPEATRGCWP